ncbi:type IV secretion system protein [Helicobacter cetorum]|uniref:VirB6 type IV secretion protein n=1 Tax=Helicobacter cetorum (strain ATCC BAA-540 / CCUG 52418 / MIT 99-5656) TaxID=1163745 RepID=I0EU82_HELCM|nr:type IV secretion system protein [Helicobacter cetorum]AFI06501.1 hypothetical protein HCD_07570 [Helicobacter cetorum MIT 99-5656]
MSITALTTKLVEKYKTFMGMVENIVISAQDVFDKSFISYYKDIGIFMFSILIILYIVNRVKNQDLTERKHLIMIAVFGIYLTFFHYSLSNPKDSRNDFMELINYPSMAVTHGVDYFLNKASKSSHTDITNKNSSINIKYSNRIQEIIVISFTKIFDFISAIFTKTEGANWLYITPILLLVLGVFIIEILFLALMVTYMLITFIEFSIYSMFYLEFIPLVFFQQTRGFAWTYVKKLISLTFYMPLIMLLGGLNSFVLQTMVKDSASAGSLKGNGLIASQFFGSGITMENYIDIGFSLLFIIIMGILCLRSVLQVPKLIDAIFGTQGTIADAGNMISNIAQVGGMVVAATAGMAKRGYVNASGGQGGAMGVAKGVVGAVGNTALGVATGGASHLAQEGISKASNMLKPKISVERFSAPNRDWE